MVWGSQQEIGSGGLRTLPGLGFSRGVDPDSRGLGIHLPPGPENGERRALRASCGLHSPLLSFSGPHCLFLPSRLIQSQPEVLRWGAQEGGRLLARWTCATWTASILTGPQVLAVLPPGFCHRRHLRLHPPPGVSVLLQSQWDSARLCQPHPLLFQRQPAEGGNAARELPV